MALQRRYTSRQDMQGTLCLATHPVAIWHIEFIKHRLCTITAHCLPPIIPSFDAQLRSWALASLDLKERRTSRRSAQFSSAFDMCLAFSFALAFFLTNTWPRGLSTRDGANWREQHATSVDGPDICWSCSQTRTPVAKPKVCSRR